MGDPQLDDGIANLIGFNGTLAAQTPDLSTAADELAEHAHDLDVAQQELRAELAVATANLSSLESETGTYAGAVESEAESVGSTAQHDVDSAATAIDSAVREADQAYPKEIASRADAMEHYMEELQDQGFAPLHQTMNQVARGDMGNWAASAEEALHHLDERVHALKTQLLKDQGIGDDSTWMVKYDDQQTWIAVEMAAQGVEGSIPAKVADAPLHTELASTYATLKQEAHTASETVRARLAELVTRVGDPISQRTMALIDATTHVLEACALAEHGAGEAAQDAGTAVPRATAVEKLTERIDTAENELLTIQSVLQAMNAP